MKVVKPMCLSLLSRPFEFGGRKLLGVSIMAMLPLDGERELLGEPALWQTATEVLGQEGLIDAGLPKRRAEVLVGGNAWTREGTDRTKCRVRLVLGAIRKELNVFGDRVFRGDQPSPPEPFECIGLNWSNAFGGEGFAPNPLGKGAKAISDGQGGKLHPLPNIEYPNDMLHRPGQKTRPAGFGLIDMGWPQRIRKGGTYDKQWLEVHFPGFPPDIDWSYFNAADEDQQIAGPFSGDESWVLENMHPDKPRLTGSLPGIKARCFYQRSGSDELEEMGCQLTTVWFFPEKERMVLVYHSAIEVNEPDARDLDVLMVAADAADAPRSIAHYGDVLAKRLDEDQGMFYMLSEDQLGPVGFRKNIGLDSESILGEIPESVRAANMEKAMQKQLEKGAADVAEGMASLELDPPEPEKPPDIGFDAAQLKRSRLDELPEMLARLNEQAKHSSEALEQQAREQQAQLEASLKELKSQYPDQDIPDGKPQCGPPRFDAARQEAQTREQIEQMKSNDIDASSMEQQLLNSDMLEFMGSAEDGLASVYRLSAHMQSAIGDDYSRAGSREQLLQALKDDRSLYRKDFCRVDLSNLDLAGRNLKGIYLESANLRNCNLAGAVLDDAVLARADLSGARLDKATLGGANLGQANLKDASAVGADFSSAILTGANLGEANLSGARLDEADLRDAQFAATCLSNASARELFLMETAIAGCDFSGADLSGSVFFKVDLDQCNFATANLSGAVFLGCRGVKASFVKANLHNLRVVVDCDFRSADFSGAELTESNFRGTLLSDARFVKARLDKADFSEIHAEKAEFYRACAKGAQFISADLRQADLRGINLMEGSLERADLREASLEGSNLFALDLSRAHVDRQTNFDSALTKRMRIHPLKFPRQKQ